MGVISLGRDYIDIEIQGFLGNQSIKWNPMPRRSSKLPQTKLGSTEAHVLFSVFRQTQGLHGFQQSLPRHLEQ